MGRPVSQRNFFGLGNIESGVFVQNKAVGTFDSYE